MKPEEAMKFVGNWISDETRERQCAAWELKLLSEALIMLWSITDKQVPKKPVHGHVVSRCATCDGFILTDGSYCTSCGQAIDWEVTEDE